MTAAFQADRVFVGPKKRLPGRARAREPRNQRRKPLHGLLIYCPGREFCRRSRGENSAQIGHPTNARPRERGLKPASPVGMKPVRGKEKPRLCGAGAGPGLVSITRGPGTLIVTFLAGMNGPAVNSQDPRGRKGQRSGRPVRLVHPLDHLPGPGWPVWERTLVLRSCIFHNKRNHGQNIA